MNLQLQFIILFSILSCCLMGQLAVQPSIDKIEALMKIEEYEEAQNVLEHWIDYYNTGDYVDSLCKYVYYVGMIELNLSNQKSADDKLEAFVESIISTVTSVQTHLKALESAKDYYNESINDHEVIRVSMKCLELLDRIPDVRPSDYAAKNYSLGVAYYYIGNISESTIYFQRALELYESDETSSVRELADVYNGVGNAYWKSSQLDSAKHYFVKGVQTILDAEGDSILYLYYATAIKANVIVIEAETGNIDRAIETSKELLSNYDKILKSDLHDFYMVQAKIAQGRAIINLASYYVDQGNVDLALNIMINSYQKKYGDNEVLDDDQANWLNYIGQLKSNVRSFSEASVYFQKASHYFEAHYNPYLLAASIHGLATVNEALGHVEPARIHYERSEKLYQEALGAAIDSRYATFFRDYISFLSDHNQSDLALKKANKLFNYLSKNAGSESVALLKQMIFMTKLFNELENYEQAMEWVEKASKYIEESFANADTKYIDFNKTRLILPKATASYALSQHHDTLLLIDILNDINNGLELIEKRKETVLDRNDIELLLVSYSELAQFAKKITLELFETTQKDKYLNQLIELQESSVYNRIRARLNLNRSISFSDVPNHVLMQEQNIRERLQKVNPYNADEKDVFTLREEWDQYLASLHKNFPEYYEMRYARIKEPLNKIIEKIPSGVCIIRYMKIDEALYAYIINEVGEKFVKVNDHYSQKDVFKDSQFHNLSSKKLLTKLKMGYDLFWRPIENHLTGQNIIIIPDAELFNCPFELLCKQEVSNWNELSEHSLLNEYNISYNYALMQVGHDKVDIVSNAQMVSFTPEFTDQMKEDYLIEIEDSLNIDQTYLHLLPQSLVTSEMNKMTRRYRGRSFVNEGATKAVFLNAAKEHKIIHIGTHAECNNVSPEMSRLIFAKETDSEELMDDNYVYSYEIYDYDFTSDLAILTACETGKPTYQAGEGMISLAHAFNYAGSQSILTSLWQIDEHSSTEIIGYFLEYLENGENKDQALRLAKLDYLQNNTGKKLHPQYWAGLVLFGSTDPIELEKSGLGPFLWLLLVGIILVIFAWLYTRHSKRESSLLNSN